MPELGYVVYLLALSYGLGQLWYSILGHHHDNWMRHCSYPFLGIVAGEAFAPVGPEFYGVHVTVAFLATLVATIIDRLVHTIRPASEPSLHPAHV